MNKFEAFISAIIAFIIELILTFWEPINRVWTELFGVIYKIYEMSPEKPIMVLVAIKVIEFLLWFVGILAVIVAGKRVVSSIK